MSKMSCPECGETVDLNDVTQMDIPNFQMICPNNHRFNPLRAMFDYIEMLKERCDTTRKILGDEKIG